MAEILIGNREFEQPHYHEIEQKFIPVFPEQLSQFRSEARPIEQLYLSHPDEPFSLRLRETLDTHGELVYTATIKDRGAHTEYGIDRMEIETEIHPETYAYYHEQHRYPTLQKLRSSPHANIAIDYYPDGTVRMESENQLSLKAFQNRLPEPVDLMPAHGSHVDNEWLAHFLHRQAHGEALPSPEPVDVETVTRSIYQTYLHRKFTAIGIGGRSGSGKSTLLREVTARLQDTIPSIHTLSTDDYHRGKNWLETYNNGRPWTNWDDPIVYDTAALGEDIARLARGEAIYARRFNFATEEPEYTGVIEPSDASTLVLVEGLHAHSPELADSLHGFHKVTTPLATCVGRRIMRDFFSGGRVNESLPSPEVILRYMLETAEPTYQSSARGA